MISRFSFFFILVLLGFASIYLVLSQPTACNDPVGCVRILSKEPVALGLSVINTGQVSSVSLEIQRSVEMALQNINASSPGHPFVIHSYFSSCLPNVLDQSAIDLSADNQIVAVVGPACAENSTAFMQRMHNANKSVISPVAYRSTPDENNMSFHPDVNQLASQAAAWIQRLGYTKIKVNHDFDEQSISFSTHLCEIISSSGICNEISAGSDNSQFSQADAAVQVLLDEANPPRVSSDSDNSVIPQILVSFSKPQIEAGQNQSIFWIGPQYWNENQEFLAAYYDTYKSLPVSLASGIIYRELPMVYRVIKETALTSWDGSWILPLGQFELKLEQNFATNNLFCMSTSNNCTILPFLLYRLTGNEYKLFNP